MTTAAVALLAAPPAAAPIVIARAPSSLAAVVSGTTVHLAWSAATGDAATSYVLEAGTASGRSDLANADTGSGTPALTATAVPPGRYFMRVRTRTRSGTSAPSNETVVNVGGACSTSPGAPTGLAATVSGSSVVLTWQSPSGGCAPTAYVLEAGSASGLSNLVSFNTGTAATTYSAAGVAAGTYYVRIRSADGSLTSAASNEITVTIGGCGGAPSAPTGLGQLTYGTNVTLRWNASTGSPSTYVIEAGSSSGSSNVVVFDTGNGATIYTATAAVGTYYVRVRARNSCGLSGPSFDNPVVVRDTTLAAGWISEGVRPTPESAGFPGNNFGDSTAFQLRDGRWRLLGNVFGALGSAISPDGLSLTVEPGFRLRGDQCGHRRVFRLDDGRIRCYCSNTNGIVSFISNDEGLTFTSDSGLLIPNSAVGAPLLSFGGVVRTRDGRWRMYFSDQLPLAQGPLPAQPPGSILSASSSDLVTWTVDPGVRIGKGATASGSANHPAAIVNPDGSISVFHARFYIDYLKYLDRSEPLSAIWMATSSDGLTFTSDVPIASPGADPDIVALPGGGSRLYYEWGDQFGAVFYSARTQ